MSRVGRYPAACSSSRWDESVVTLYSRTGDATPLAEIVAAVWAGLDGETVAPEPG